jgi:hypothetical protein
MNKMTVQSKSKTASADSFPAALQSGGRKRMRPCIVEGFILFTRESA